MQRVVRSTLVGLVALASLTACGDKTTIVQPTTSGPTGSVRGVTVTPATATLNVGDQITLVASVNADANITDRTVTWSSSNTAIATVDAAAGTVKAIAAGTATITAASKADPTVKGAALITVGSAQNAVVSIATINQTNGFNSVPANLGNVAGQIDVTLNVDPGSQKLAGVDLVMNCAAGNGNSGKDTVVATQNLSGADIAAAEAAAAPITLSFNTGSFTSATGVPAFFNGACTIKGVARTTAGTTVATAGTPITLNNADVMIGSITSTKTATDAGGLTWHGGDVTVTTTPVFYSGRVAASTVVTFEGKNQTVTGAGTKTVTFVDANDLPGVATGNLSPAANDIDNITDPAAQVTFTLVDAAGNNFTTNPCGNTICSTPSVLASAPAPVITGTNPFRLDTQAPLPGTFNLANNVDQGTTTNGYIGANFRFAADSAAGYRGPNAVAGNQTKNADLGGVDKVSVVFQTATSITGTFTNVTTTSGLPETNTGTTNVLRMITTDALGNADTSYAGPAPVAFRTVTSVAAVPGARYGVDLTAPTVTFNSAVSAVNGSAVNVIAGHQYAFSFTDNLSGTGLVYVAQVRNYNSLSTASAFDPTVPEGKTYTNTGAAGTFSSAQAVADVSPCIIGRFNASQAAAGAGAVQAFDRSGAAIGWCTPVPYNLAGGVSVPSNAAGVGGYYKTVVIASDEAGNRAPAFTSTVLENPTTPTVANIDLPGSITGNATASFPASVTETSATNVGDITSSWAQIEYDGGSLAAPVTFQYPVTPGPGVAFDNVLTRTATVTPTVPNFAKSLVISNGVAAVAASANNADSVKVFAADPSVVGPTTALNAGSLAVKLAPAVQLSAGSSATLATNFTAGFRDSTSTTTPSLTGTPATLFAIAQGNTGIFNNPFSGGAVTFWYRLASAPAASPWFFISSVTTGVTQDTGAPTGRSWIYSTTFTIPANAPDGTPIPAGTVLNIRAVGVNTAGDAVGTAGTTALTVNP